MTDYHSYSQPQEGTADWHVPLNENFDRIDADIEIRDAEENLGNYTAKQNAKFLATDTGRIYLSDGSQWIDWGIIPEKKGGPDVIVAEDASEIQPAIDELSERVVDNTTTQGDIQSGVVKLKAKNYHPTDTIWLKRGVILEGSVSTPFQKTARAGTNASNQQRTTIHTDQMPEGPGALYPEDGTNTWSHFDTVEDHRDFDNGRIGSDSELDDITHPHLAVINAFDQPPVKSDTPRTDYQNRHVGYGIGLRNVTLDARSKNRWWDPANESGTEASREATYFGVYDAIIFERITGAIVENVNTIGFHGYNGFYQDTTGIISRGNSYGGFGAGGTATDHHGATLQLDYSFRDYVKGVWSVDVTGPAPTCRMAGHVMEKFVDGAWRNKPTIRVKDDIYLGTKSAFDAGNAPLVEPYENDYAVLFEDQQVMMNGYRIEDNASTDKNGVYVQDNRFNMNNSTISVGGTCIVGGEQSNMRINNSKLYGRVGLETTNWQGTWNNVVFSTDDGIVVNNANSEGGFHNCRFMGERGVVGSANTKIQLQNPDFSELNGAAVTDPSGWVDSDNASLVLANPTGYENEASGRLVASGDNTMTSFSVTHGMDEKPEVVRVTPTSSDATGDFWVETTDTELIIKYKSAPTSGSDNLRWSWQASGWSTPAAN
jgi:hypothetical protein